MARTKTNPHEGSSLDDLLRDEGIYAEVSKEAIKEVVAWELGEAMKELSLSKSEMARRMGTSRAALDRLLEPKNHSVTLQTLSRAAGVLGKKLRIELVDAA